MNKKIKATIYIGIYKKGVKGLCWKFVHHGLGWLTGPIHHDLLKRNMIYY